MTITTPEVTTTIKPQTPIERRANCNPVLIGLTTGGLAPNCGTIFGVRQRSWALGLVAWLPIVMWAWTESDIEGGLRDQSKYAFQLASGVLTGAVALVKKKEAQEELAQD